MCNKWNAQIWFFVVWNFRRNFAQKAVKSTCKAMCSLKGNTFKACSWKTFHYVAFSNSHSSPQSWWYTIMNLSHCNQVQFFLPWRLVFLFDSTRKSAETRLIVRKIDMLLLKLVWKIALKNTHQPKQWSSTKIWLWTKVHHISLKPPNL